MAAWPSIRRLHNNGGTPLLLTKAGPGQLVLGNAGNSFTGGTVVGGGILTLGAAGALGPATNSLLIAGGSLDLNGQAASRRRAQRHGGSDH